MNMLEQEIRRPARLSNMIKQTYAKIATYRLDRGQGLPASALILQQDLVECNGSRGLQGGVVELLLKLSPLLKSLIEILLSLCNAIVVGMKPVRLGITFAVLDGCANVEDKVVCEGLDRRGISRDNVLVSDGEVLELKLSLLLLLGCLLLLESRSLGVGGGGGVEGGVGA